MSDVRRQDYGWRFLLHRVTFGLLPFGGGGGAVAAVDYHHTRTNAFPARRRRKEALCEAEAAPNTRASILRTYTAD